MKKLLLLISVFLVCITNVQASNNIDIVYTSPEDGSRYLRPEETIIVSVNEMIDESTLIPGRIEATGKKISNYPGSLFLSSDDKTILFRPTHKFLHSDTITIKVHHGIKTADGDLINPKEFIFIVRDTIGQSHFDSIAWELGVNTPFNPPYDFNDPLPESFPDLYVLNSHAPSSGRLFFSNFTLSNFNGGGGTGHGNENRPSGRFIAPYLIIYDNDSGVYYQKGLERYGLDFKVARNGNLVYFAAGLWKYIMMDTNYNIIDTIQCGNGYPTDGHELLFLENGHMLMMSYDPVILNMSVVVPGGEPRAEVTGLVIQELDREKNVVFQWRSWEHFEITDGLHENLTLPKIDYSHGNSIEPDWDGNLLISSRHMDEITKINRSNGEIIWRFGGLNNEFTFLNDDRRFTYQHDARRVAPGRITLFDNGNHHTPPYSRVIEYELDEVNKTAKLVWEYNHNKEIFAFAMGNAQRLPNGNTVIGWGTGYPSITEVDPNGDVVFEMAMEDSSWTYRALRYDFRQPQNEIPDEFNLSQNYPNPFNPATNISFEVPSATNVVLEIYDMLGRKVDELVNSNLAAGNYNMIWNAEAFSSGIYFYTLKAGDFNETKKMVLLK